MLFLFDEKMIEKFIELRPLHPVLRFGGTGNRVIGVSTRKGMRGNFG